MKIQAKEVKVGMTVSWGVVTLTVKEIVIGFQKNGKEIRTFKGPATRSYDKVMNIKPSKYPEYDFTAKSESILILK